MEASLFIVEERRKKLFKRFSWRSDWFAISFIAAGWNTDQEVAGVESDDQLILHLLDFVTFISTDNLTMSSIYRIKV